MLKIYGSDLSVFSNKVRFVANALGIEYEYIKVNLKEKEHRLPEYLKMHPAGKVPVVDDEGFILFESNAIIKYLADKNNAPFYSKEIKKKAEIDQWIDFCTMHIGDGINRVVFNRVFASRIGYPVDENSIKTGMVFLNRFLPIVDEQISKTGFLIGSNLSLADISLVATLDPVEVGGIDILKYENIVQWRNKMKQKDFYAKCYKEYGESLKETS